MQLEMVTVATYVIVAFTTATGFWQLVQDNPAAGLQEYALPGEQRSDRVPLLQNAVSLNVVTVGLFTRLV